MVTATPVTTATLVGILALGEARRTPASPGPRDLAMGTRVRPGETGAA
jgi:hypothetical protein